MERLEGLEERLYKILEENLRLSADYRRGLRAREQLVINRIKINDIMKEYRGREDVRPNENGRR